MNIELDIENTIASAITTTLAPERLQAVIEKHVGEVVDSAIKSAFSTYGDFSKTVTTAVKALVPHELSLNGAANWNHAIGQHIKERIMAVNDQRIAQVMTPMLDELLEQPPAELKVSELVAKAVEFWSDEYGERRYGRPSIHFEHRGGLTPGYWHLYLDQKPGMSKYSCGVQFSVNDKGSVYSLKVHGQDIKATKFAGPFFQFDAYLFQLYTGGTKLIVDTEDFDDVCYPEESYA